MAKEGRGHHDTLSTVLISLNWGGLNRSRSLGSSCWSIIGRSHEYSTLGSEGDHRCTGPCVLKLHRNNPQGILMTGVFVWVHMLMYRNLSHCLQASRIEYFGCRAFPGGPLLLRLKPLLFCSSCSDTFPALFCQMNPPTPPPPPPLMARWICWECWHHGSVEWRITAWGGLYMILMWDSREPDSEESTGLSHVNELIWGRMSSLQDKHCSNRPGFHSLYLHMVSGFAAQFQQRDVLLKLWQHQPMRLDPFDYGGVMFLHFK